MGFYGSKYVTLGVDNDSLAFERGHSMQMRPRGDISKVAVRDGSAKRFENANFHDHTLKNSTTIVQGKTRSIDSTYNTARAFLEVAPRVFCVKSGRPDPP